MPAMLFRLRGVPDDEADEIRALLDRHRIDYYETPEGKWGVSMAAIWVNDDDSLTQGRQLIEQYQQERSRMAREQHEDDRRHGRAETLADRIRRHPVRFIAYLALALFVLYLSLIPFFGFGRQ